MIAKIPLDQGLVTSRHASLLASGELTRADDCRYRVNNPALWRAWGRTQYISAAGQIGGANGKIIGVVYCPFEPNAEGVSDNFLIIHQSNKYYTSVFTARTGTISGTTIDNVGTGTHLDACHANNRWFLFNGNPDGVPNVVLKPGITNPVSRSHGLVPVSITPTNPTVATVAGTWPRDDTFWGEGRFFFFTTEVVSPGATDELESAASFGEPPHVDLQKDAGGNINYNVVVTRHTPLANATATQVNVYMVKASLYQSWDGSLLARAFRVGTISVSATPANDTATLSGNYTFFDPAPGGRTIAVVSGSISNASNMAVEDGSFATVDGPGSAVVDITNWGFAVTAGAAIVGIKVWIRYRAPGLGSGVIDGQIRYGAGPTLGTAKRWQTNNNNFLLDQRPWPNSETDTWGLTLVGTDVNQSNFGVRLSMLALGLVNMDVDVVKMRVYTAVLPSIGPAYPIVSIQEGNVLTVRSANSPPPTAGTGDVIDGALVVDNVNNRRELAYSLAGRFDYFPALYKIGIDSKEQDKVMVVRRVGDIGLIFMLHQVYRLNYVPYSTDPEFIPGRCYEAIVPDHGCVSRQGVQVFQMPGGPILAGYIAHNGIYINDGNHDRFVSEDIDWSATVDVTQLSKAVLLNYPKEFVLKMEYVGFGTGATENNRYLLLHYHQSHRKANGQLKITGPNKMKASCGCLAKLNAEDVLIAGHNADARLYVEDNALSDAEGTGINTIFETGEIYPQGEGKEVTVVRAWAHHSGNAPGMVVTMKPRYRNTGAALVDFTSETFIPSTEGLVLLQPHFGLVDAVRYQMSIPDAVEYVEI